jgi:hypothetical protein
MKIEKIVHDYYKIGDVIKNDKFGDLKVEGYTKFTKIDGTNPIYIPFTRYGNDKYLVLENGGLLKLMENNSDDILMKNENNELK